MVYTVLFYDVQLPPVVGHLDYLRKRNDVVIKRQRCEDKEAGQHDIGYGRQEIIADLF